MNPKIDRYVPPAGLSGPKKDDDGRAKSSQGYFSKGGNVVATGILAKTKDPKPGEYSSEIFGSYKSSDIKDQGSFKQFVELEIKLLTKFNENNGKIDLKQFSAYLKAAVACFKMDSAVNIPQRIFASQNPPLINIFTCNILIAGYCNCGNLRNAVELFNQMKSGHFLNISPDATTYNTLLEGYIKANKSKDAMELYQLFKQDHPDMLDIRTYTAAIKLMVKFGQLNDARELFNTLLDNEDRDLQPNRFTYNTLLEGYINSYGTQSTRYIENLVLQMKLKSIKPDNITLNLLMIYYFKQGKADRAVEHFEALGVTPNQINYFTLINNLINSNKLNQACEYLIQSLEVGIKFDNDVYENLLRGLRHHKNHKEIVELFEAIQKSGIEIKIQSYAIVVDAYLKLGKKDQAVDLMQLVVDSPQFNTQLNNTIKFLSKCLYLCVLDQAVTEFMLYTIESNKDIFINNPKLSGRLEKIEQKLAAIEVN